jgi:hypothetical protein
VKIGSAAELVAKGEKPPARQWRNLFPRIVVLAMSPHEIFALTRRSPRAEGLAADKWAKHLALDPAAVVAR